MSSIIGSSSFYANNLLEDSYGIPVKLLEPSTVTKMTQTKALAKAKEAKETKDKLMLGNSFLTAKQLLGILQRTPKNHIYTRPAKGGGTWDYVTGTYIKKVLNHVFGWMWDFRIAGERLEYGQVIVKGELTVKNKKGEALVTKMQYGRADIKLKKGTKQPLDLGNDFKSAATDALKKCASEFGIASDIYGKNEFKEIRTEAVKIGGQNVKEMFAGTNEKNMIEKLCRQQGADDPDKAYDLVKRISGIEMDFDKLTKVDSGKIIAAFAKIMEKQAAMKNGRK